MSFASSSYAAQSPRLSTASASSSSGSRDQLEPTNEQKRVTMMLDELENELLTQRSSQKGGIGTAPAHSRSGSVSTYASTVHAIANYGGSMSNRTSRPVGPPPSEPLPQLPTFPSSSSGSGSRPSSSFTRKSSSAGTRSNGASTPATSFRPDKKRESDRQESWINSLAGPRASSTFSRTSFDSTHHVTARYTICAADDDDGNQSQDSHVLSHYYSFADHGDEGDDDDEQRTATMPHTNTVHLDQDETRYALSPSPSSFGNSVDMAARSIPVSEPRKSLESMKSIAAPSTIVPTVMIDDVDGLSDGSGSWDDSEEDDSGRRKRRKKPNNRWRFEDQRALAPSLSTATAARLVATSRPPSLGQPFMGGSDPSSSTGSSFQIGASGSFGPSPLASAGPASVSFAPGSIVPPSASEFKFYEFAPDLPPFAPKDLTPKDLTGTGTWRSIVARAVTSANAGGASQRESVIDSPTSSAISTSGPVSVRQLAAETRARQQRELVMQQRQAQLFAQTKLEPIDLHRHAQQMASMSGRGMSPSPAPSFVTSNSVRTSSYVDDGDDDAGTPGGIHRGLFRSASVSLSGYWDPLENISGYGEPSLADGASVRSSTFTNPGLGLEFQRPAVQSKIYADSGAQTSPTSSPSTSRPGSPSAAADTGGAAGESMAANRYRAPRKVLADGGTQTDLPTSAVARREAEDESDDTEQGDVTPSTERTLVRKEHGSASGSTPSARPQLINRRRSTLGIGAGGNASRSGVPDEEPEGWRTPLRVPKLSSRRSNIGTSPSGFGGGLASPSPLLHRASMSTLRRKPLSPLGLGQGMNRNELTALGGVTQTDGSDAGVSDDDSDDSDPDSCESDLDLETPLEELAERSGALTMEHARGEKRKFERQRKAAGRDGDGSPIVSVASLPSSSAAAPASGRDGSSAGSVSGRIVAPLPRGLRQAAANGALRFGPQGQIGGRRGLGAGLRAGGMRTTAVAYSSDEEDATATETEVATSARRPAISAMAGSAHYPRSPASFTQSKVQMRPSVLKALRMSMQPGSQPDDAGALSPAPVTPIVKARTLPEEAEREACDEATPPARRPRDSASPAADLAAATPTAKLTALPLSSALDEPDAATSAVKDINGRVSTNSVVETPTRAMSSRPSSLAKEGRRSRSSRASIPEIDALLLSERAEGLVLEGLDSSHTSSGSTVIDQQGQSQSTKRMGTLQDDEDLLTSDIDFAMPPSGDSFQSIDDLDGILDSPNPQSGFGVRSVTGTASLRKPVSVPALVSERLLGLAISDKPAPAIEEAAKSSDSTFQALGPWDGVGGDDDMAYASSTIHGHSRAGRPVDRLKSSLSTRADAERTPSAANIDLPETSAVDKSTAEATTPSKSTSKLRSSLPIASPSIAAEVVKKPATRARPSLSNGPSTEEACRPEPALAAAIASPLTSSVSGTAPRQRSASQASRIRAPASGRSSLPGPATRSGIKPPSATAIPPRSAADRKNPVGSTVQPPTPTSTAVSPESTTRSLRKMKSFGDRSSSSSFVSPSVSTMPRPRPLQTPSPELSRGGGGMSSGSSRPGSALAMRRTTSSTQGPSRPPSSTSMRRAAIPARKNSDALPSNLPQPPSAKASSAASPTLAAPQRALASKLTAPKQSGLRSPGFTERASEGTAAAKARPRTGSTPTPTPFKPTASGSARAVPSSPDVSQMTDTSAQNTPPSLSSRGSSMSSSDSLAMPATPASTGAPSSAPLAGASTAASAAGAGTNTGIARRMASTSNLRKPSAIARPSGLPTPAVATARTSGLPLPKSYKV